MRDSMSKKPLMARGLLTAALAVVLAASGPVFGQGAGAEVDEPPMPAGTDVFDLDLGQTIAFSRSLNFEVVGHSYLKGPWLTQFAQDNGLGAGINTPRVDDRGFAYLGGYNSPPTMFGVLIVDVRDPTNMEPLSFIPCKAGTRCPYVRVNNSRRILVFGSGRNSANPVQPPPGVPTDSGWSFWDVSDPTDPQFLSHISSITPDGSSHGMEIDDQFLYGCGRTTPDTIRDELQIIDYEEADAPVLVSTLHIQGQRSGKGKGKGKGGEEFEPQDLRPDGTPQSITCHEITIHKDRLYIAYRDAGLVVVDVTDRSNPKIIGRADYMPPFRAAGGAHTSAPVVVDPNEHPSLVVNTDEIFSCPPGFGRIIDVSDLQNPQVINGDRDANLEIISSYRVPHVSDVFDFDTGQFVCGPGSQSIHLPWFDVRSPSLLYQAWYTQGVRVWDISNPFLPREIGFYLSPPYLCDQAIFDFGRCGGGPPPVDRHTREVFQDPVTELIYVTDGSGGGLTVLRWTGPIPPNPPIPGAR